MGQVRVSLRYARALFQSAVEKASLEKVCEDIRCISQTYSGSSDLRLMLFNPVIRSAEKKKSLQSLFEKSISPLTLQFLMLVVEKKRETLLADICRNFDDLYRNAKGVRTAVLSTVVPVDPATRAHLIKWIEQQYTCTVELREEINPALKGGFLLRVDDTQLDMSVSSRLRQIRNALLKTDFEKTI